MSTYPSPVVTRGFFRFGLMRFLLLAAVLAALAAVWAPRYKRSHREARLAAANEQMLTAAAAGDLDGVDQAISDGARLERRDEKGRSALDLAVEHGNRRLAELLIEKGAARQPGTTSALAIAVRKNELTLARRLLEEGVEPNWNGMQGYPSLLHLCIEQGALKMMDLLIEFGADVEYGGPSASPLLSGPPLLSAIRHDKSDGTRLQMVQLLLERGADPNIVASGTNAMDLAIQKKDAPLGDLLREHGATYGPREAVAFGRFGEVQAMVRENPALVEMRYRPYMAARPGQEPTLLGIALRNGDGQMARLLIDHGAPLDVLEGLGGTLLHAAARGGNEALIRQLVESGLEVDARDDHQDTPLTDCAWSGPPDSISALIQAGSDVNARGMNGRTALHLAVANKRIETVRVLLAAGADPSIPDDNGETAVGIARDHHPDLVGMLEAALDSPTTEP